MFILFIYDFFVPLVSSNVRYLHMAGTVRRGSSLLLFGLLLFGGDFFYVLRGNAALSSRFFFVAIGLFRSRTYREVVIVWGVFVANGVFWYLLVFFLGYFGLRASRAVGARLRGYHYLAFYGARRYHRLFKGHELRLGIFHLAICRANAHVFCEFASSWGLGSRISRVAYFSRAFLGFALLPLFTGRDYVFSHHGLGLRVRVVLGSLFRTWDLQSTVRGHRRVCTGNVFRAYLLVGRILRILGVHAALRFSRSASSFF